MGDLVYILYQCGDFDFPLLIQLVNGDYLILYDEISDGSCVWFFVILFDILLWYFLVMNI